MFPWNKIRCDVLNIWVDPWATWVHRIPSTDRRLARSDRELAHISFSSSTQVHCSWQWHPQWRSCCLSKNHQRARLGARGWHLYPSETERRRFRFELLKPAAFLVRTPAINQTLDALQSAQRHDNLWDVRDRPLEIALMKFSSTMTWQVMIYRGWLQVSYVLFRLACSMPYACCNFCSPGQCMMVLKKFKAGLATSDCCQHCFETATRMHIFQQCPYLQKPHSTSWTTGIIFEDDSILDRRKKLFHQHDQVPHGRPFLLHQILDVFIDGSCFYSKCRRFAILYKELFFFAPATTLRLFSGNVAVFFRLRHRCQRL